MYLLTLGEGLPHEYINCGFNQINTVRMGTVRGVFVNETWRNGCSHNTAFGQFKQCEREKKLNRANSLFEKQLNKNNNFDSVHISVVFFTIQKPAKAALQRSVPLYPPARKPEVKVTREKSVRVEHGRNPGRKKDSKLPLLGKFKRFQAVQLQSS